MDALQGLVDDSIFTAPLKVAVKGAFDRYAGWYDLYDSGACQIYCSWSGASGGDPSLSTIHGSSHWTCQKQNGIDAQYPLPFTFKRCDAIDALINSTKLVLGDTSQGQVAALAEAVAEHGQNLPGYCCLDTPDLSGIWGEPFDCQDECQKYAPSFAGISTESCDTFGGTFCTYAQDCSPLQECVEELIQEAEKQTNPTYLIYLKDAPVIEDATDNEQCGDTREYFGYERTFPIDKKICDEVKEYRNTRDFTFMDAIIEEMEEVASERPEFEILTLEIQTLEKATLETEELDAEDLEKLELEELPRYTHLQKPERAKLGLAATRELCMNVCCCLFDLMFLQILQWTIHL